MSRNLGVRGNKKVLLTKTVAKGDATGEMAGEFMVQRAKDVDDGKVELTNLKQEPVFGMKYKQVHTVSWM